MPNTEKTAAFPRGHTLPSLPLQPCCAPKLPQAANPSDWVKISRDRYSACLNCSVHSNGDTEVRKAVSCIAHRSALTLLTPVFGNVHPEGRGCDLLSSAAPHARPDRGRFVAARVSWALPEPAVPLALTTALTYFISV